MPTIVNVRSPPPPLNAGGLKKILVEALHWLELLETEMEDNDPEGTVSVKLLAVAEGLLRIYNYEVGHSLLILYGYS